MKITARLRSDQFKALTWTVPSDLLGLPRGKTDGVIECLSEGSTIVSPFRLSRSFVKEGNIPDFQVPS